MSGYLLDRPHIYPIEYDQKNKIKVLYSLNPSCTHPFSHTFCDVDVMFCAEIHNCSAGQRRASAG